MLRDVDLRFIPNPQEVSTDEPGRTAPSETSSSCAESAVSMRRVARCVQACEQVASGLYPLPATPAVHVLHTERLPTGLSALAEPVTRRGR